MSRKSKILVSAAILAMVSPALAETNADFGDAPDPEFPSKKYSLGALHLETSLVLGDRATKEGESKQINRDEADDGIVHFSPPTLKITNNDYEGDEAYINILADLDSDGEWKNKQEWVVRNYKLNGSELPGQGDSSFVNLGEEVSQRSEITGMKGTGWVRITLTDSSFQEQYKGKGWFDVGETEDYRPFNQPDNITIGDPPTPPPNITGGGGGDVGDPVEFDIPEIDIGNGIETEEADGSGAQEDDIDPLTEEELEAWEEKLEEGSICEDRDEKIENLKEKLREKRKKHNQKVEDMQKKYNRLIRLQNKLDRINNLIQTADRGELAEVQIEIQDLLSRAQSKQLRQKKEDMLRFWIAKKIVSVATGVSTGGAAGKSASTLKQAGGFAADQLQSQAQSKAESMAEDYADELDGTSATEQITDRLSGDLKEAYKEVLKRMKQQVKQKQEFHRRRYRQQRKEAKQLQSEMKNIKEKIKRLREKDCVEDHWENFSWYEKAEPQVSQGLNTVPENIRSQLADKNRLVITDGSEKMSLGVELNDGNADIKKNIEDPGATVKTSLDTIASIKRAEDKKQAALDAFNSGEIQIEGHGASNTVKYDGIETATQIGMNLNDLLGSSSSISDGEQTTVVIDGSSATVEGNDLGYGYVVDSGTESDESQGETGMSSVVDQSGDVSGVTTEGTQTLIEEGGTEDLSDSAGVYNEPSSYSYDYSGYHGRGGSYYDYSTSYGTTSLGGGYR